MPNQGGPLGPLPAPNDAESAERLAASEAEVQRCLAAGMREREARIEGAKAAARMRRVQLGLEPDTPDLYYVPPEQRWRNAKGELVPPSG